MSRLKYPLILILVLGGLFLFRGDIAEIYTKYFSNIEKSLAGLSLDKVKTRLFAPPPLRGPIEQESQTPLRVAGVLRETNAQRAENGLGELTGNSKLNLAAQAKVDDMFEKQYFAHVSPTGQDAADLAELSEYQFIAVGENLALGNYANDQALVQAWMDSPGHRENILNSQYQEIGIAVKRGSFEGHTTWLAVQIFGLARNACPQPDAALKASIETNQSRIDELESEIAVKKEEIEETRPKRGPEYNAKVEAHNTLVSRYNALIDQTKNLIDEYNSQVRSTNDCIAEKVG